MSVLPFEFNEMSTTNAEIMEKIRHKIDRHPLHSRRKVRIFYKGRNRNGNFVASLI